MIEREIVQENIIYECLSNNTKDVSFEGTNYRLYNYSIEGLVDITKDRLDNRIEYS